MKRVILAAVLAALPVAAFGMEPLGYIAPNEGVLSKPLAIEPGERIIATALITTKGAFIVHCYKDWHEQRPDGKPQRAEMQPMQTFFRVFTCGKESKTYTFAIENEDQNKKALLYGLQVQNGPMSR